MDIVAERIQDGRDLRAETERIARENEIEAGSVLSGVGGLKQCRIRVPVIRPDDPKYIDPGVVEIIALHGTVAINKAHIHIAVSDETGRVWGGHLSRGCIVRMTCELVIMNHRTLKFHREHDPETGYDELIIYRLH